MKISVPICNLKHLTEAATNHIRFDGRHLNEVLYEIYEAGVLAGQTTESDKIPTLSATTITTDPTTGEIDAQIVLVFPDAASAVEYKLRKA